MRIGNAQAPDGTVTPLVAGADDRWRDASSIIVSPAQGLSIRALARLREELDNLPVCPEPTAWAPSVPEPRQIVCVGLNYTDHAEESGMLAPEAPIIFGKSPRSITGPQGPILLPTRSTRCDWEVELGLVVGTPLFEQDAVDPASALLGYCLALDISERDWQLESPGQWTIGKSYPSFCPLGPWILTPDSAEETFSLELEVNGATKQDGRSSDLIFSIPQVLSYLSRHMLLDAGDLVLTGTPAGVGMATGEYLHVGDQVRASGTGLGTISATVVPAGTHGGGGHT